jgi:TonB family protein
MNRLQKKCIIASIGFHLSLLVILFVSAAFLARDTGPAFKPIDFVPVRVIEGALAGGGNPDANPLPPAPPAPQPPAPVTPPVQEQVKVEQPKELPKPEPVKIEKPGPAPAPPKAKPVKQPPQISTTLVTGKPTTNKTPAKPASTAKDDERKKVAEQFGKAAAGLRNKLAPTTSIELRGIGGGGDTYAGVQQTILSTYDRAWISPQGVNKSEAIVEVEVTVESDGSVSSAHITTPSGDAQVDRSVEKALRSVSSIPGWDGKKRTVEFSFNTRAKEMI